MLVQLVHHGGLPDAGITGHQHQFRRAIRRYPLKSRKQGVDLGISAVQLVRDQKLVRNVVNSERERGDLSAGFQSLKTLPQVSLYTSSGLVTFLRYFSQELHDYASDRLWHTLYPPTLMHPLHTH